MISVHTVCDYFLQVCYEHGDYLTNLKLQKLVYYAQAWYLALYNQALFDEDCQAWVHGPVVPSVYSRFSGYGWEPIGYTPKDITLPPQEKKHLDEIAQVFNKFTAYQLEQMTHQEEPWKNARHGLPPDASSDAIISKGEMQSFYAKLANNPDE